MDGNYWASALRNRVSRRRAIIMTGGAAAAAAFLAAFGDSNSTSGGDSKGPTDKSGLVTKSVDTSKAQAQGLHYVSFGGGRVVESPPPTFSSLNWLLYRR